MGTMVMAVFAGESIEAGRTCRSIVSVGARCCRLSIDLGPSGGAADRKPIDSSTAARARCLFARALDGASFAIPAGRPASLRGPITPISIERVSAANGQVCARRLEACRPTGPPGQSVFRFRSHFRHRLLLLALLRAFAMRTHTYTQSNSRKVYTFSLPYSNRNIATVCCHWILRSDTVSQ